MIALPPSNVGALKLTVAVVLPAAALKFVGAPGFVIAAGVTLFDTADAGPVPVPTGPGAFVAVTVNVYAVPFVKPVTVMGLIVPVAV